MAPTPTVISSQSVVCGDIISATIYVEGKVIGNIRCECLVVRRGGIVQGDIIAGTVIVDGHVTGIVRTRHAHLKKHASIDGSVVYTKIVTEHGAQITGQLSAEKEPNATKSIEQQESGYITQNANSE